MSWKANTPSLVVVVVWSIAVAVSVALTVAFGTTPPDGSVTVPLMVPRKVWAFAATASDKAIRIATARRFIDSTPPQGSQKLNSRQRRKAAPYKQHLVPRRYQSTFEESEPLGSSMKNYSHSLNGSRPVTLIQDKPPGPARPYSRLKNPYTVNANMAVAWICNPLKRSLSRRMNCIQLSGKFHPYLCMGAFRLSLGGQTAMGS